MIAGELVDARNSEEGIVVRLAVNEQNQPDDQPIGPGLPPWNCPYCGEFPCNMWTFSPPLFVFMMFTDPNEMLSTRRQRVYQFYNMLVDQNFLIINPDCVQAIIKTWLSTERTQFVYRGQFRIGSTHQTIIDPIRQFRWDDIRNFCLHIN